jgi:hypothetical protein
MAQRLRSLAAPPTDRLDSMDMNRTEFGRGRTEPTEEYMRTPNEPIMQTNGQLVLAVNIFSSRNQAMWHPGLPLMFNTSGKERAHRCMDIFEWQMMMYDQSVQLALERIRRENSTNSNKRYLDSVEKCFRDVDEMAATWRFGGTLYAPPSPYGRDGPYESNFNYLEGQVLTAPVVTNGCMYMTNIFRSHRRIPIGAECYMILKKVKLDRVDPPFSRDGGIISFTPSEAGSYIKEDRCMVAVFVWTRGGLPEEADPATRFECVKTQTDPPLHCRSYLDYETNPDGSLRREKGTGRTRPIIKEGQVFLMGKALFRYNVKNHQTRRDTEKIEIPVLKKTTKEAGEQIYLYLPPVQRLYC